MYIFRSIMGPKAFKNAVCIIVDVGPYMSQPISETQSALDSAKQCATKFCQKRMFAESSDFIQLIVMGTPDTVNDFPSPESDMYKHLTMMGDFRPADWKHIEQINKLEATHSAADLQDTLALASVLLKQFTISSRYEVQCSIVLFSNLGGPRSEDKEPSALIKLANDFSIDLTFIGPNLDNFDPSKNDHGKLTHNFAFACQLMQDLGCAQSYTFHEADAQLDYFRPRLPLGRGWNVDLEIADGMSIPVRSFIKVQKPKLPPLKSEYVRVTKGTDGKPVVEYKPIESIQYFEGKDHNGDEEDIAKIKDLKTANAGDSDDVKTIDSENVVTAHKYGSTCVPFSDSDAQLAKLPRDQKQLRLLSFADLDTVPRSLWISDKVDLVYCDSEQHMEAFVALHEAMSSEDVCMLVRRVYNAIAAPQIACLVPSARKGDSDKPPSFIMVNLPFDCDVRGYEFHSLDGVAVNEEEQSAMDDLVGGMTVSGDCFKPTKVPDPFIQRLYACVDHRIQNPIDIEGPPGAAPPLPNSIFIATDPSNENSTFHKKEEAMVDPQTRERNKALVERCKKLFPTSVNPVFRQRQGHGGEDGDFITKGIFEENGQTGDASASGPFGDKGDPFSGGTEDSGLPPAHSNDANDDIVDDME